MTKTTTASPRPTVTGLTIMAMDGWALTPGEQGLPSSYHRAMEAGFGVVIPVRDYERRLVISSGPATDSSPPLESFLSDRPVWPGRRPMIGLLVQSSGLAQLIHRTVCKLGELTPYVLGMSVPDIPEYLDGSVPVFVRQSEYEPTPAFYECAEGVWLDSFERDWYDERLIVQHLRIGKHVVIASPELHDRPHSHLWEMLHRLQARLGDHSVRLQLCTRLPLDARTFFGS